MSWIEHVSWCLCFMIYLIWIFPKDWRALLINIFKARHRLIIKIPLLCGTALWAAGLRPGYRIHWLLVMLWDECICPGVLFGRILSLKAFTLPDLLWCRIPGPQGFEERSVQCLRPSWPMCSRTRPKARPAQQHGPAGCHRGLCDLSGWGHTWSLTPWWQLESITFPSCWPSRVRPLCGWGIYAANQQRLRSPGEFEGHPGVRIVVL